MQIHNFRSVLPGIQINGAAVNAVCSGIVIGNPAIRANASDKAEAPLRLSGVEQVAAQEVELADVDEREDVVPDLEGAGGPRGGLDE